MNSSSSSNGVRRDTASELCRRSLENGQAPTARHGTHANCKALTNVPRKVIDIVSKNADYRRPMSRKHLLGTTRPAYSVCRALSERKPLARRPFNSDPPQLGIMLQDR
jgi:hypothetical protein